MRIIPDASGVYFFYNRSRKLIYVGKASSLKNRVASYFSSRQSGARNLAAFGEAAIASRPIEAMLHEVAEVKWQVTDSALEAVILESLYIKKYWPKYNVLGKDNKSWNYITVSADEYPLVQTLREHERRLQTPAELKRKYRAVFGPYPGLNTLEAMKILRRCFMFSTCQTSDFRYRKSDARVRKSSRLSRDRNQKSVRIEPGRNPKFGLRPCFYYQLGQCLGVCTGEISPSEYRRRVIRPLTLFLRGQKKKLLRDIERRMRRASRDEEFEEAARLRNQLRALSRIQDVALLNESFVRDIALARADESSGFAPARIEGYDISNLGATGMVGSLVVFNETGPLKSYYRKFRIRTVAGQSDVDCLEEVLRRRLKHTDDWPLPDLFLIDGGASQVNRAVRVLHEHKLPLPVVGIAKGPERKRNDFYFGGQINSAARGGAAKRAGQTESEDLTSDSRRALIRWVYIHQKLLIQVRDEAHRFALQYQKKIRQNFVGLLGV